MKERQRESEMSIDDELDEPAFRNPAFVGMRVHVRVSSPIAKYRIILS
jgi:hypothetical protein